MALGHGISDDWEDVADDNLSIVSLPVSEENGPVVGSEDLGREQSMVTGDFISESTTFDCDDYAASHYKGKGKAISANGYMGEDFEASHRGHQTMDLRTSRTLDEQFRDATASEVDSAGPNASQHECTDGLRELQDLNPSLHVNPTFLLRVIESVRSILDDTIQSVNDLTALDPDISEKTLALCQALVGQVVELGPIVTGYSKVWSTTSKDIPLDPGLYAWLSGVRVKALGLQVELQDEVRYTLRPGRLGRSTNYDLQSIWQDLEDWKKQMDDFLPIMQVDYNEFHTQRMSIPTARAEADSFTLDSPVRSTPMDVPQPTAHSSSRNSNPPLKPSDGLYMLRAELYHLKDEIQRTIESLCETLQHLTASAQGPAREVAQHYDGLFKAITTMLSNHGSEWIEHGLAGGLTYAQFAELDVDCIRVFAARLDQVLGSLEATRRRLGDSDPVLTEADFVALGGNIALEQLQVVAQVLSASLNVETA